jgi:RHH-type proline utilization regulon transcriptional repressor/proline dehydrogenase/delta 1-pyrroline-5-carboxylate dehydrogenase
MSESSSSPTDAVASAPLADRAVELARRWVTEAAAVEVDPAARRLADVLQDANGLPFTLGFVDGVMRPESLTAAASQLHRIAPIVPEFLPWYLRGAVRLGGGVAPILPSPVVPIARRSVSCGGNLRPCRCTCSPRPVAFRKRCEPRASSTA